MALRCSRLKENINSAALRTVKIETPYLAFDTNSNVDIERVSRMHLLRVRVSGINK